MNDDRQRWRATQLRRLARLPPSPRRLAIVPPEDVRLIVVTLMELLQARRGQLDILGHDLRDQYERFACAVRESGFRLDETRSRKVRAARHRRLGELAEVAGDVAGAVAFYELALAAWPAIGCRRRLADLRRVMTRDDME